MLYLFAWRYLKAKKSIHAINIIAWTSVVAILFGTAALILVLSVFNGFEALVKSLYSAFYTDLKVMPANGKTMFVTPQQLQKLKNVKGIKNFSLVVEEKALLQNGEFQTVIYLKGVDENYRYTTGVAGHLIGGEFDLGTASSPRLLLGAGVEEALGIVADRNMYILKIYLPRKSSQEPINITDDISSDTIRSAAAFLIQQDFDNKYGITHIDFVKKALRLGKYEYGGIEIALTDPSNMTRLKQAVTEIFGKGYVIQNKYEQNRSLYSVMNVERWAIYGIFCLVMIVAAFNMTGALTMLVLEKQKDINILHALGAGSQFIQRIFLCEGLLLALTGGGIGMLLALLLAWLQTTFHLIPLGGSFLISHFPVKLRITDFLLIGATVLIIALIASWIPARKAAAQQFSLRSE